jgi:hypothetical protein
MVEPEKNPGGIPVDRDGNAAPALADGAMTVGNERSGSLCLRHKVLIALAVVLYLIRVPDRSEPKSQSGNGRHVGRTQGSALRPVTTTVALISLQQAA